MQSITKSHERICDMPLLVIGMESRSTGMARYFEAQL